MKKILSLFIILILIVQAPLLALAEAEPILETINEVSTPAPVQEPPAEHKEAPTAEPTEAPTAAPTEVPTAVPTETATVEPTAGRTETATTEPTAEPTETATVAPTETATVEPTEEAPAQGSTLALALPLALDDVVRGTLTEQAPTLYYAFRTGDFSCVEIKTTGDPVSVELLKESGSRMATLETKDGVVNERQTVSAGTTCVLAVTGSAGASFTLKVSGVAETIATATPEATLEEGDGSAEMLEGEAVDSERLLPGTVALVLNGEAIQGKFDTTGIPAVSQLLYSAMLPSSGLLTIYLAPQNSAVMEIWDENLTTKYATVNGTSMVISKGLWLEPGSYHIIVRRDTVDTSFTIRAAFMAANNTISGANSTLNAYNLTVGTTYATGVLTEDDKQDILLFQTTEAGKLTIDTRTYESGTQLRIVSADNTAHSRTWSLNAGGINTPGANASVVWIEKGSYYLYVTTATSGPYDIRISYSIARNNETEPNNGIGTANTLLLDSAGYRGLLSLQDSVDCYVIRPTATRMVNVVVKDYTNGLGVQVWGGDSSNVLADLSKNNTGGSEQSAYEHQGLVRLEAGKTYYVVITNIADLGVYELSVTTKLTVESVVASPTAGALGAHITVQSVISGNNIITGLYRISIKSDSDYVTVSDTVSKSNTFSFTPPAVGTYRVSYLVYDGYSWASCDSADIVIGDPVAVTSVTLPTSAVKGQTVTGQATTSGSPATLYAFEVYTTTGALVAGRTYSANPSFTFTVPGSGLYYMLAYAFDGVNWVYGVSNYMNVTSPLKVISLTPDKTTSTINNDITFTMATNGGDLYFTNYQIFCNGSLINTVTKTSGDVARLVFKPQAGGTYMVKGAAYDGNAWHGVTSTEVRVSESLQLYSLVNSSGAIKVGESVTFTLTANAVPGTLMYRVLDTTGAIKQQWIGNDMSHTFTFPQEGIYVGVALAYDAGRWMVVSSGWISVSKTGFEISSVTLGGTYTVGSNVYVTLTTTGAPLTFTRYIVQDAQGNVVTSWDGNSHSFVFRPTQAGVYFVNVIAYDGATFKSMVSPYFRVY